MQIGNDIDVDNLQYLYHGTNPKWIKKIVKEGLKPRSLTGKSNWESVPEFKSRDDMVYLTYSYPFYFSVQASEEYRLAVVEIDFTKLDEENFYPDEDVIAQATARKNNWPLKDVHLVIKSQLEQVKDKWRGSLEAMGTLSHSGIIPPEAISRYVIVNLKKVKERRFFFTALDPQISIINFVLRGTFHKNFVAWVFGDRKTHPQYDELKEMKDLQKKGPFTFEESLKNMRKYQKDRTGIEVVKLNGRK